MSFRFRPKSDEIIQKGVRLTRTFEMLSVNERNQILALIQPELNKKLLALSGFIAEAAINNKDISLIRPAIILHVLNDFQKDYRENIRYLVLVAHAAKKLGVDFRSIVNLVLPLASERAKKGFLDFSARDDSLNKLSSFGMQEDTTDGTFRFVPISHGEH